MRKNSLPKHIIVGLDGSESSIAALRHAADLAAKLHASLEAIMTWEYPVFYDPYYSGASWSPETETAKAMKAAIAQAFETDLPRNFTQTVLQGAPARVLIRESEDATMLVLGSRGHGGFAGLLLGSVSATCAAHATCPVLIVHTHDSPGDSA
ncbi:universal stress protein [Microbacterium sp. NPDC087665]|uniref:universal stress protein n=1 Tax=Microbacterium sp. NPDC087665 TaxID=3364194 RepID=UPI0038233DCC